MPAESDKHGVPDNDSAAPATSNHDIDFLRGEIDRLDQAIIDAIKERTDVSRAIGKIRMAQGGPRLVHNREMKVLERFQAIGPEGYNLAMILLRLGRGVLGKEPES